MSYTSEDFTLLGLSSENWILLIGAIVIVGIVALTANYKSCGSTSGRLYR